MFHFHIKRLAKTMYLTEDIIRLQGEYSLGMQSMKDDHFEILAVSSQDKVFSKRLGEDVCDGKDGPVLKSLNNLEFHDASGRCCGSVLPHSILALRILLFRVRAAESMKRMSASLTVPQLRTSYSSATNQNIVYQKAIEQIPERVQKGKM